MANRLPVRRVRKEGVERWETSPGGLVSALKPMLDDRGGAWIGWPGTAGAQMKPWSDGSLRLAPVALVQSEVERFYSGFSNASIWPLYHDGMRTPEFHRPWWAAYESANRKFAEAAAAEMRPRDLVWVQDYHLQLVPAMLREARPEARIGFFLHIPFPAEELFARLPWRRQILEGLLGADVIGFQTRHAAQNFIAAARQYAGARGTGSSLAWGGRMVRVEAFPISIDFEKFETLAARPEAAAQALDLQKRLGESRKILLGVDRLDYTKGIDVRLRAFGEMLRRGAITSDKCVMVQVAVPSRESVAEYADMRRQIEELVGKINGEYGEPGRAAVHYLRRTVPHEQLAAYYLAAHVMVVTPLRDGMNLVAKEYVASRVNRDGALVLSEFAGAAEQLRHALLVNPYDIDGVAATLERALTLSTREERRRMTSLRRIVREHDVHRWSDSFLEALSA